MPLNHRANTLLQDSASSPEWGTAYQVVVTPVGGVASGASTGTTITVSAPHSAIATDKIGIFKSDNTFTFSGTDTVQSVTATTIVMGSSYTITAGDLIVVLGPDTGTTDALFNASPMALWSDADGGTLITNATVTCDSLGNYDYYFRGDGACWEVILDSLGAVKGVTTGFGGTDRYNVCDYGASARATDGIDDYGRIQAVIDQAEAAVNPDTVVNFNNVLGQTVYCPAGDYRVSAALSINEDAVEFHGAGRTATTFYMTEGTAFLVVGDGATPRQNNSISRFTCTWNDSAFNNVTFNAAAAADTIGIHYNMCTQFDIDDVRVYFDENNTIAGLVGFKWSDSEIFNVKHTFVVNTGGPSSGTNYGIAYLFDGGAATHGNAHFDCIYSHETQVGIKIRTDTIVNGLTFTSPKVTNANLSASADPKYAIWMGGGVREVLFHAVHIEGENSSGTVNPFDIGVWFDANMDGAGRIQAVTFDGLNISRATTCVQMDGAQNYGHLIRGSRIFGDGDHTTGTIFSLDAGVNESQFLVMTSQGPVTTTLTDNSAAESRNLFMWDDDNAAALDTQDYKFKGDVFVEGNRLSVGDSSVDADSQINFQRTSGNRALKYDESAGLIATSGTGIGWGKGATGVESGRGQADVASATSTSMSGATVTLTSLIPAGSMVYGVSVYVGADVTSGAGTDWDVGVTGTVNQFFDGLAFPSAAGVDYDMTDATFVLTAPQYYTSATNVLLTCQGGTFSAGDVRVSVYYLTLNAPTAV